MRSARSRRAVWTWGVVGVVTLAVVVLVLVYMVWFEDDDIPSGPEEQLETIPAEDVEFEATVRLGEDSIEYDYRITNQRDGPLVVVDPNQLSIGSPAEEGPATLWRAFALRRAEPGPLLDVRGGPGRAGAASGLLLEPGETRTGHVTDAVFIDDPPEHIDLCLEVVEDDLHVGAGVEVVELADRPAGEPVPVVCTGPVPVD